MRTVEAILVVMLLVSMLVLLGCSILAFTVGEPPAALGTISAGTMALATGLLCLGEAVSKGGSRAKWRGSDAKVGRLSSFAFGIGGCAMGVVFLGYYLLPEQYLVWTAVVFLASFALALLGMRIDRRAYARETRRNSQLRSQVNGLPEEQRDKIRGLAKSEQRLEAITEAKHLQGISLGDAAFVAEE